MWIKRFRDDSDGQCAFCNSACETVCHSLFECLWMNQALHRDIKDILFFVKRKLSIVRSSLFEPFHFSFETLYSKMQMGQKEITHTAI